MSLFLPGTSWQASVPVIFPGNSSSEVRKYLIFSNFSASHRAPPLISLSSLVSVPKLGERFTCLKIGPRSWDIMTVWFLVFLVLLIARRTPPPKPWEWPGTVVITFVEFSLFLIGQKQSVTLRRRLRSRYNAGAIQHGCPLTRVLCKIYDLQAFRWKQRAVINTKKKAREGKNQMNF